MVRLNLATAISVSDSPRASSRVRPALAASCVVVAAHAGGHHDLPVVVSALRLNLATAISVSDRPARLGGAQAGVGDQLRIGEGGGGGGAENDGSHGGNRLQV